MTITIDEYNSIRSGDLLKLRQPTSDASYRWDCPYVRVVDVWNNRVYIKVYWSRLNMSRIHQLTPTYRVGPDTIEQIVERAS